MATDHAVSDHSTNEKDDEKINEEIKTIEQDGICPTEKNEITDSSSLATTGTKSEENVRDDQIKPPVLVEVETVKDAPSLNVPVEEKLKVAENPSPESGTSTIVAERAVEVEKDQEGKAAIESSENHPEEQPAKEAVDKQPHNEVVMEEAIEKQPVTGHVEKESEVKSVIESIEKHPEEQPTTKNFGKISEEKSAIEAIEKEPEEQTGTEVFEKQPEEKIVIGSIERQHEEQPATEAVDKKLEKAAIESIEKQPEQQVAAAVVERQQEELMAAFESTQKQPQDQAFTKTAEKQPQDELPNQPVKKEPEEQIKVTDVPHLAAENLMEHLEVSPPKEEGPKVVQEPEEVSEAEVKITEQPASINKVHESPKEQSEVTDQIEKTTEELKPKGMLEGEVATDEKTLADKVGESLRELQASKDQVPDAFETSDQVFSTNQEAQDYPKKDGGSSLPDVVKKNGVEDAKKEDHGDVVAGGLSKGADMQEGKIQEKKEKDLEVDEETEGKNVKNEKSSVEEKVSRVAEVVPEQKRLENVEDVMPASGEANENRDEMVEDINTTSAIDKHVEDVKKSDLELEAEETKQTGADKLAETHVIAEIPKSDVPDLESSKDKDLKNSGEAPKEEVTIKHTQKQSNNLISKVKHSLAKVKKAITGKSPSSKNLSSEAKGDIKVN